MPDQSGARNRFAELVQALAGRDGVTLGSARRGFGSSALQVNGRIFAMLSRDRLVVRLPRERVAALLGSGDALPYDAGKGAPLKGWVMLEDRSDGRWSPLAREALAYVAGLGPPTR